MRLRQPYIGTSPEDSVRSHYLTGVSGTNTVTGVAVPSLPALLAGNIVTFVPAGMNSGAVTVNIDAIGAKDLYLNGAAMVGGELSSSFPIMCIYDGTRFHIAGGLGGGGSSAQWLAPMAADQGATITVGANKFSFRLHACTVTNVRASLVTASSSGNVVFDVNDDGVSIFGAQKLQIDQGATTSVGASASPTISNPTIAFDSIVTVDIDSAGTAAKGWAVYLQATPL